MMPEDKIYWYKQPPSAQQELRKKVKADVVIVGGGMAGLMCAQACRQKGLSVIVLEAGFIGSGASGKSSGFITPDSELQLNDLLDEYGARAASDLWEFVTSGCEAIRKNILEHGFDCDYQVQDSLFVANKKGDEQKPQHEHEARQQLKYESRYYTPRELPMIIGSPGYHGAVRYNKTFGMVSYAYCQSLKALLESTGVQIYENSPVQSLNGKTVTTPQGQAQGKNLVFCTDWLLPSLGIIPKDLYHAQTFLALSRPLPAEAVKKIFPEQPLMVWDTDLIYQYYRVTGENRLLLGGGTLLYTYLKEKQLPRLVINKFYDYLAEKFPSLKIELEYFWPGLIGVSKDFLPVAGAHHGLNNIYYTGGAAGLPWAAALGKYLAEKITDGRSDLDRYFSTPRDYPIGYTLQAVLGTRITFALSHGMVKYLK